MAYKWIDMKTFPRKHHFEYFNSLTYPYVGVTVNVDITDILQVIKKEKLPFFLTICYCAARAANSVSELRQRIKDGKIIEYDFCRTSHTVALEDGTYCYCTMDENLPFPAFLTAGKAAQEEAKRQASIEEEPEEMLEKLFVSTLPWLTYTAIVQPVPLPADSNPRIMWGKYFRQEGRTLMPVTLLCHHALVDGIHLGAFYQALDRELAAIVRERGARYEQENQTGCASDGKGLAGEPPEGAGHNYERSGVCQWPEVGQARNRRGPGRCD